MLPRTETNQNGCFHLKRNTENKEAGFPGSLLHSPSNTPAVTYRLSPGSPFRCPGLNLLSGQKKVPWLVTSSVIWQET